MSMEHLTDREISWLSFDQRVLELAEDESIPVLERLRFLAIASDVPNGSLIQVVVNGERAELTLRCRTSVTDSMRAFVSTVEKLDEFGLHVEIDNKSADDEFVLFLRRERLSQ